jgi:hypothetical protein
MSEEPQHEPRDPASELPDDADPGTEDEASYPADGDVQPDEEPDGRPDPAFDPPGAGAS